jgi:hypothetical protein
MAGFSALAGMNRLILCWLGTSIHRFDTVKSLFCAVKPVFGAV